MGYVSARAHIVLNDLTYQQGRYLPLFASAIYEQNKELTNEGLSALNLVSIMIGTCFSFPGREYKTDRVF